MRVTEGSMWLTPDNGTPAMVVKIYYYYRNQLTGEYEPAVELLAMDGQEITLFTADMKEWWQPARRFKKVRQTRFANGLNYEWECVIEGYKPLRMIQSIRHDDPLMQATPTAKQIACWRRWVTPTPA